MTTDPTPRDWRGFLIAHARDLHGCAHDFGGDVRDAASSTAPGLDVRDCECVPGHRCDCIDLRQLLTDILTNAEYPKMEAEGLAAAALGLRWSEKDDRYVRGPVR